MPPFGSSKSTTPTIKRYTVRSPLEAGEPRSRDELNALRALGAILDKRAWWTKWTKRPEIQRKWIAEIEDALVRAHVTQVLVVWPQSGTVGGTHDLMEQLNTIANLTDQGKKVAQIEALLAHVLYPAKEDEYGFAEGVVDERDEWDHQEEDTDDSDNEGDVAEGDDDSDDEMVFDEHDNIVTIDVVMEHAKKNYGIGGETDEDHDGDATMNEEAEEEAEEEDAVLQAHKNKNPFAQIAWYVTMTRVREQLQAMAPVDWTGTTLWSLVEDASPRANDEVVARTCSLILAILRATDKAATCSIETINTHVPHETREDVLRILQLHFQAIHELLETTKDDMVSVLDVIIKRLALPAKDEEDAISSTSVYTPGSVPHVWMSDGAIAADLKTTFISQVAVLENVPEEDKDWHPNSNNQVLDVVHPSLYCGVVGQTPRLPQSAAKRMYGSPAEHLHAILFQPAKSKLAGPKAESTKFQWLPSEVDIDTHEDGARASILTYINNLHPELHPGLYQSIEQIFTRFVPLFDTVLSSLDNHASDRAITALYKSSDGALPCAPRLVPPGLFETSHPQLSLKGTRCQVIVKIAEIHLTPASPSYDGGSWHIEGTDAERIIATGLYYFNSDNITTSRLAFRTFVQEPMYEQSDHVGIGMAFGLYNGQPLVQHLGSLTAMEDRCVVFPNIYQHKVEPFELVDPTRPGVRKILAFFLVDPTAAPIASTAVVPPQQQAWIDRAREVPLKCMRLPETVQQQIQDLAREGTCLEAAKIHRINLMAERSPSRIDNDYDYIFSLCEH